MLDRTVHAGLPAELEKRGVRCVHGVEDELVAADARAVLECAIEDECLLVTRNYADYARLGEAYRHAGVSFPGILFLPPDALQPGALAERISRWLSGPGESAAPGTIAWLD